MMRRDFGQRLAWRRRRGEQEEAADFARMLVRRDVERDASVVDERAIEARRLPVGEQIREQVRLGVAVGEHRRRVPRHVDARQLDAILEHEPDLARQRRGGLDRLAASVAGGISPKYCSASSNARSVSMSPASASDALAGW